jgi:hypothetical protein
MIRSTPSLDAALVSREAPGSECLSGFGLTGALFFIVIEGSFAFFGVGLNEALLTTTPFLCLLGFALFRARRLRTERIVVENGVIRISHYVQNRLVEQRRMKLCDVTIEFRESINRDCTQIALRTGDRMRARSRSIEIARRLAPAERALFLEELLEGLRRSGANPELHRTCVSKSGAFSIGGFLRINGALVRDGAAISMSIRPVVRVRGYRLASCRNALRVPTARRRKPTKARNSCPITKEL